MQRVALHGGVVLLLFEPTLLLFLVAGGHVTGRMLALSARFGAFQNDVFTWHNRVELTFSPKKNQRRKRAVETSAS